MLNEIIDDYIKNRSSIVTSATNNGTTSLILYFCNQLAKEDKLIVFYCPVPIDYSFIKKYYPNVFQNCIFIFAPLDILTDYLEYIDFTLDYLVIDPGDTLLFNKKFPFFLFSSIKKHNGNIICSSQIRQDPTKGGQVYSTIEEFNKTYKLFNNSIWIRNVSETSEVYDQKYIDVFENHKQGNSYSGRYVAMFSKKEGFILG